MNSEFYQILPTAQQRSYTYLQASQQHMRIPIFHIRPDIIQLFDLYSVLLKKLSIVLIDSLIKVMALAYFHRFKSRL